MAVWVGGQLRLARGETASLGHQQEDEKRRETAIKPHRLSARSAFKCKSSIGPGLMDAGFLTQLRRGDISNSAHFFWGGLHKRIGCCLFS